MQSRVVTCILEVAGDPHGKDADRLARALLALERCNLAGNKILHVHHCQGANEPTTVPDFGHNHRCRCENPEPWGVKRYFGLLLFLEKPIDAEPLCDYNIPGTHALLAACGLISESREERTELGRVNP